MRGRLRHGMPSRFSVLCVGKFPLRFSRPFDGQFRAGHAPPLQVAFITYRRLLACARCQPKQYCAKSVTADPTTVPINVAHTVRQNVLRVSSLLCRRSSNILPTSLPSGVSARVPAFVFFSKPCNLGRCFSTCSGPKPVISSTLVHGWFSSFAILAVASSEVAPQFMS